MFKLCIWLTQKCNCVGKFYLVDSGYANQPGYLAPYKGPSTRGKKELFNSIHSSLRNVIDRSFGVLKKWKILKDIPSFAMQKQRQIILACMALHNLIKENDE
jgi:hypothetical protein